MAQAKNKLSSSEQRRVRSVLLELYPRAEQKSEQNCTWRLDITVDGGTIRVKQYTNGTFWVDAPSQPMLDKLFNQLSLSASLSQEKTITSPSPGVAKPNLDITYPYIGTDESGKGDFFGPLVIAGAYLTETTAPLIQQLGVTDSKLMNDQRILQVIPDIHSILGPSGSCVIEISPKRYNELYASFVQKHKNLNHLLAWGHAKVIETLLQANPTCPLAVADQFGNERYIQSQLQTLGKTIRLIQMHKAEQHLAVACASVLARAKFVQKINELSYRYEIDLPFGASQAVITQGRQFVKKHGSQRLDEVAKTHFKTTQSCLSPS